MQSCFQIKREESSWPRKCLKFKVGGTLASGRPTKTLGEVLSLEKWIASKELVKDLNA